MSSHHFVKEGQEPSVWVLGTDFNEDTLGTLLEWSPLVITTLSAAEKLFSLQIKTDRIITETDDETAEKLFTSLYPIEWHVTKSIFSEIWEFLEIHRTHLYVVGLGRNQLIHLFQQAPADLKQFLTGITLKEKWICPASTWNKWLAKDQAFQLTGDLSGWTIEGKFLQKKDSFFSEEDQLFRFENHQQECFIEYLPH